MFHWLVLLAQLQLPAPVGYVNDFAQVIDPASQEQMLAVIEEVRQKSGGEIVVVTLPDLGGRPAWEVTRDIGRQWRVGAQGAAGDRARNAGLIILLKPGQRPGDGRAELAIAPGTGAEGFVTDAFSGRVRDAIGEAAVQSGSYATGLVTGVWMIGQAYAREFDFELTGNPPAAVPGGVSFPPGALIGALILLFLVLPVFFRAASAVGGFRRPYYRAAPSGLEWLILSTILSSHRRGGRRRGGWGSGGFGGGGFGGGGGGFGGFGGGGGFSGGGASGRF